MANDSIVPEPSEEFVATPYVQAIAERALCYLQVGYPVHFAGPAGTGKTTLALHIAASLGRPVILVHGDDEFGSSDLIGRDTGYHRSRVVDNFIHSVLKTHEEMKTLWVDNRLTTACRDGYTLIYDEFNRSRPEANNALLSILSERILNLPKLRSSGRGYLAVHPQFRVIFTSNPEEYAGTHKTQDALMDRLITIRLEHLDRESEVRITGAKSGVSRDDAEAIVDIVRALRDLGPNRHRPTIRTCIALARVLAYRSIHAQAENPVFRSICHDILGMDTAKVTHDGQPVMSPRVEEVIRSVCSARAAQSAGPV
ncbi:MAG TPA: gas vesicle protein GvpN [Planctomycetota bacterium]|nr:gas vesicle protein GvpN [Planctomycetota bacterium]